ncbi:MAG TPA: DegT/DnrJ/EryC1/StrS family aminotransferase, partial [Gemmatimonadaceae bacterium]|nr:DegT/DnrJ/EryC1/StrS family aminotransferase [Gemmatimonadaceae bacterium]
MASNESRDLANAAGEDPAPVDLTRFTYFRGRVALAAILKALGVTTGDEVLLQAFTCVAVPEAIISIGAIPVYVDVEPGGINMDADDLSAKIGNATKAVIVQHS